MAGVTTRSPQLVGDAVGNARPDEADQGCTPRLALLLRAGKLTSADAEFLCVVRDASEDGISVRLFHPLPRHVDLELEMPNGDRHPLERVWEDRDNVGFRFRKPVELDRIIEAPSDFPKRSMRVRLDVPCCLVLGERRVRALIGNLSQQGALIRTQEYLSLAQRVGIEVHGLPEIAARVRWRHHDCYGLGFEDMFQFAELASLIFDLQREGARMRVRLGETA